MLTPDDGRTDGVFTDYLGDPSSWRGHDSVLFDTLRGALHMDRLEARAVGAAEEPGEPPREARAVAASR